MHAWIRAGLPASVTEMVDAGTARRAIAGGAVALDVREAGELAAGRLPGALHVPLGEVAARAAELPRDVPLVVYCGHGERASSAVSLMEQAGPGAPPHPRGGARAGEEGGGSVE